MINRTCCKIHFFFDFSKKIWRVFFSDNARELYFLIIRMQKSNNFIRKRMGKILSKTRSNWLSCLAGNFVITRSLWVKVSCKCDLSYFCKKKLLGSTESIFSIEEWVVFMTHQFNSICCIFCDLHGCHLQFYGRCFLILLQLLSKILTLCVSKPHLKTYASIMIFNKLKIFVKILMLKIDTENFIVRKNLNRFHFFGQPDTLIDKIFKKAFSFWRFWWCVVDYKHYRLTNRKLVGTSAVSRPKLVNSGFQRPFMFSFDAADVVVKMESFCYQMCTFLVTPIIGTTL